jgi:hypothetical protein
LGSDFENHFLLGLSEPLSVVAVETVECVEAASVDGASVLLVRLEVVRLGILSVGWGVFLVVLDGMVRMFEVVVDERSGCSSGLGCRSRSDEKNVYVSIRNGQR